MQKYCRYIGYPVLREQKALQIIDQKATRQKYLLNDLPDKKFRSLLKKAIIESNKKKMLVHYETLTKHVLKQIGGCKLEVSDCIFS